MASSRQTYVVAEFASFSPAAPPCVEIMCGPNEGVFLRRRQQPCVFVCMCLEESDVSDLEKDVCVNIYFSPTILSNPRSRSPQTPSQCRCTSPCVMCQAWLNRIITIPTSFHHRATPYPFRLPTPRFFHQSPPGRRYCSTTENSCLFFYTHTRFPSSHRDAEKSVPV